LFDYGVRDYFFNQAAEGGLDPTEVTSQE